VPPSAPWREPGSRAAAGRGSVPSPLEMRDWTGREAVALRKALRMPQFKFARMVDVSVRTVANWAANPETVPRSAAQDMLDELLAGASSAARARFEEFTGEAPAAPEEDTADDQRWVVVIRGGQPGYHPRYKADFKALALAQVAAARTALGMSPGEFAGWPGPLLGRPLQEGAIVRCEQGITPPSDAVMASQAYLADVTPRTGPQPGRSRTRNGLGN
jgi:hypothetical protein